MTDDPTSDPAGPDRRPQPPPGAEHIIGSLGDISFSRLHVHLPSGRYPIRQSMWTVRDQTQTQSSIPAYAIVLAIVFAVFCLIGLLFLLIKEHRMVGYVEVAVQGDGFYHASQLPVNNPAQVAEIRRWVDYARGLAAAA